MVARVKVDVATRSDGERVIPKLVAHRGASRRRGFKLQASSSNLEVMYA